MTYLIEVLPIDVVTLIGFYGLFDIYPMGRNGFANVGQMGGMMFYLINQFMDFFEAYLAFILVSFFSSFKVEFNHFFDTFRIATSHFGLINIALYVVFFIEQDNNRTFPCKVFNNIEPIVKVGVIFTVVGNQHIQGASGEEKTVGGVVHFLTTKVPNIKLKFSIFGAVFCSGGEGMGMNRNAPGAIVYVG